MGSRYVRVVVERTCCEADATYGTRSVETEKERKSSVDTRG